MFEFRPLAIEGAFSIHGPIFREERGSFRKTVHEAEFKSRGLSWSFPEQYLTTSKRDVIRGMHLQLAPHDHDKLVYAVRGRVLDVLVDLRPAGRGRLASLELDGEENVSVYVPRGVAHGFRALTDDATLTYAVTSVHAPTHDTGVRFDSIGFDWGVGAPTVSARDLGLPTLKDFR